METVNGVEDDTQYSNWTSDGEGGSILLMDMAGDCWLGWVTDETMEEWGNGNETGIGKQGKGYIKFDIHNIAWLIKVRVSRTKGITNQTILFLILNQFPR